MKQPLYDILDDEYCFLLDRITAQFLKDGLNPSIVGGAAVQVHIANLLSKIHGKNIEDLFVDGDLRKQDHIRATDDIDITLHNAELAENRANYDGNIIQTLAKIPCKNEESADGNNVYDIYMERSGVVRPVLFVHSLNATSRIRLNISKYPTDIQNLGQEHYIPMIENAKMVELHYNDKFRPKIRIHSLSDVIAAKLANGRAKDKFDVNVLGKCALLAGKEIDKKRILHLLGRTDENVEMVEEYLSSLKDVKL